MKNSKQNRLQFETSPYLLQHAKNPVDWYPWGEEALLAAKDQNKPIFLSVGYSACHWCHVMEKESFENDEIANVLNENFINIKVDREERPDIDAIYMSAVQIMTKQGGWPMSVFLTTNGEPIYGGTYFPPVDRMGLPSFSKVIAGIVNAWEKQNEQVKNSAEQFHKVMQQVHNSSFSRAELPIDLSLIDNASKLYTDNYDSTYGGFGEAPKFFHSMDFRVLLRHWKRTKDEKSLDVVATSLEKIAKGGVYDHLGGGFHRYSTDKSWHVPHFEKMLYDNALLSHLYLETYQATGNNFYLNIATETLDYVLREMSFSEGGYFSTQDADSEGVEGKFFVWKRDEIYGLLDKKSADIFCETYHVTEVGNWEATNILNQLKDLSSICKNHSLTEDQLNESLKNSKKILFGKRAKRIAPGTDEKIIVSWNAMMVESMVLAFQITRDNKYLDSAKRAVNFILSEMSSILDEKEKKEASLFHCYKDNRSQFSAFLDDYAGLSLALLSLYEAENDENWLSKARLVIDHMVENFMDPSYQNFFYTSHDHEKLIVRTKEYYDGATPSANGIAILALAKFGRLTEDVNYIKKVELALASFSDLFKANSYGLSQLLLSIDYLQSSPREILLVDENKNTDVADIAKKFYHSFNPNTLFITRDKSDDKFKVIGGEITLYLCENFSCQVPASGLEDVNRLLNKQLS